MLRKLNIIFFIACNEYKFPFLYLVQRFDKNQSKNHQFLARKTENCHLSLGYKKNTKTLKT